MTALRPANTSAQQMLRSPATAGYKHLKRGVVAALLACGGLAQAAVVYTFDSANYTSPNGPYTTAMHLQFSFTVANVLASSLTALRCSDWRFPNVGS